MKDKISEKIRELTAELSKSYPRLLMTYPLHLYVKDIKSYKGYYEYSFISLKLKEILDRIEKQHDANALALYLKLLLSTFILDYLEILESQNTPERITTLVHEWFIRVYKDFSAQSDSYYHHKNYNFQKDLAVCNQRAIPVGGAWIVEVSRRTTKHRLAVDSSDGEKTAPNTLIMKQLRKSVVTFLMRSGLHKRIWYIRKKLKGAELYYAIHTVDRYLPRFTMEQMNEAYLNIAELLKVHPNICGIFRKSWFLDPNLKEISPALSYLWEVPQQNGAELFRPVTSEDAVKNAIAMSPLRKKLYEEGKYKPMIYAYVWPRKELLRWASKQL